MSYSHQWPSRFLDLKRALASATTEERLTASWNDLLDELSKRTSEIARVGPNFVPQVNFADLDKLTLEEINVTKSKGTVVIKGVTDAETATAWKMGLDEFVKANPQARGFPEGDKEIWNLYWTRPQVQARAHPNYLKAAAWMNNLFHIGSSKTLEGVDLSTPLAYADHFRIRHPDGNWAFMGPHVDGGGSLRWEDKNFSSCYKDIFEANWRQYDPYDVEHRVQAPLSKDVVVGETTVFRSFQGWMALNEIAPHATLSIFPDIFISTAYIMLRPFFNATVSPDSPDFLDAKNGKFDISTAQLPGVNPGMGSSGLTISTESHPHLRLEETMISIPKVKPGDFIFWHCIRDMIHTCEADHKGKEPKTPLIPRNWEYVVKQAQAFLKGQCPPDYAAFSDPTLEATFVGMATETDVGGPIGRAAMSLY